MSTCFIGRMPILYRQHDLHAYELLQEGQGDRRSGACSPTASSSQLIVDAFLDIGIERIVGRNLVYVRVTESFVKRPELAALPSDQAVLVLPASMAPSPDVHAGLRTLKENGFSLALAGYTSAAAGESLLDEVDAVMLDANALVSVESLTRELGALDGRRVLKIASGVTTMERRDALDGLAFDCFHGNFLTNPTVVSGQRLTSNRIAVLDLLSKLADPNTSIDDIDRLVSSDPALSLRVLRFVNSPLSGLSNEVDSIHRAVVLVGRERIKSWAMLMAISGLDEGVPELLKTMFVRARFCEQFAEEGGMAPKEAYFTAGLFSLMDALMGVPISELVESLPFTDEMKTGLVTKDGTYGRALRAVELLEEGVPNGYDELGLVANNLSSLYLEAVAWADASVDGTLCPS